MTQPPKEGALRFDSDKPKFHLLPQSYLEHLAPQLQGDPMLLWFYQRKSVLQKSLRMPDVLAVLDKGAAKYGKHNYVKGMLYSRVFDAYIRHRIFYPSANDEETGLPHASHAACNILMAQVYELEGYDNGEFDDRPPTKAQILDALTADAQNLKLEY